MRWPVFIGTVFAMACGSSDPDFGVRVPADDHLCPAERPFAYQPSDQERAKAAGCAPAWNERHRVTPGDPAQPSRKMIVVCCPAR